jgi:transcriptional regulator with XRE-family HTH domain
MRDDKQEGPVQEIGRELKRIRFERDLTLEAVSELTGVSKTMLGQIERGASSPTISVLWKISKGLRVSLSSLLDNHDMQEYEAVDIEKSIEPVYGERKKMILYDIFPFNPVTGFEYFYIKLLPGVHHVIEPHMAVKEYIVVTAGELTLILGEQELTLKAPAKICFVPNIRHCYSNNTKDIIVFQNIIKY